MAISKSPKPSLCNRRTRAPNEYDLFDCKLICRSLNVRSRAYICLICFPYSNNVIPYVFFFLDNCWFPFFFPSNSHYFPKGKKKWLCVCVFYFRAVPIFSVNLLFSRHLFYDSGIAAVKEKKKEWNKSSKCVNVLMRWHQQQTRSTSQMKRRLWRC